MSASLPGRHLRALALAAPLLAAPVRAGSAQPAADSSFPLRLSDRPTTLPRGASRLDLFVLASRQPRTRTGWTGVVGGGVGVIDRLEVGGQVLPATLAPGRPRFTNASMYATYAFDAHGASLAPTLQTVLPLRTGDPFYVDVGLPVYRSIRRIGYVSVAPTLSIDSRANGAGTSVSVPIAFVRQVDERLSWQLASGIGLSRFDPRFGLSRRSQAWSFDDTTIPLTAELLYSVARRGQRRPLGDLSLQLGWPQLFTRAPGHRGGNGGDWTVQLQTSWYAIP